MEYAIEIENLKKTFYEDGSTTRALRGISLKMRKGEIFGLLGPNGAGKTTTLHILSSLIIPTSGTARILGHDILEEPVKIREITGLCMGATSFLWDMTPREILRYYSLLYGLKSGQRKERIEKLVKDLEITRFQNMKFYMLSTGMKQKVAVAKSLLNEPQVLLLDEPTAGLDVEVGMYIRKYIADLVKEKGTTVILTSHKLAEVEELCKEIAIIDSGKIVTRGTVDDIRTQARFPSVAYFCLDRDSGLEFLKKMKGVRGYEVKAGGVYVKVEQNADVIQNLISEFKRRGYRIREMEVKKPSLEDVFLKIVKRRSAGED
jgi:ABC-2 type transport system ATP-binding protein